MRYLHVLAILLSFAITTMAISAPTEISNEASVFVQFKQPMKQEQFVKWAKSFKGEVLELRHAHKDMVGAYTVPAGMSPQEAFKTMLQKHEEFLNEVNSLTADELASASDQNAYDRISKLKSGFESAIKEVESGDFGVVFIKVKADKLSMLDNDVFVLRIAQEQTIREENNSLARKNMETSFDQKLLKPVSASHESWAPYYGTSKTTQNLTFNTFYFDNLDYFNVWHAYEHETQVDDSNFADYDGYANSNLLNWYKDSQAFEPDPTADNFAIGTTNPIFLSTFTYYYTYMSLRPGTVSSAFVRIKGQVGIKSHPLCLCCAWCVLYPWATTGTMTSYTAPIYTNKTWLY